MVSSILRRLGGRCAVEHTREPIRPIVIMLITLKNILNYLPIKIKLKEVLNFF